MSENLGRLQKGQLLVAQRAPLPPQPPNPLTFADRLRFLFNNSLLRSLDDLSTGIKRPGGYAWYLLHPEAKNGPRKVNPIVAHACAHFLAGKGILVDDAGMLYAFLMNQEHDFAAILAPNKNGSGDVRLASLARKFRSAIPNLTPLPVAV